MPVQLRIARPVTDLLRTVAMYKHGLGLEEIGSFVEHDGFDGVMIGTRGAEFHLEFTFCRRQPILPTPTGEDLLVFYLPEFETWVQTCNNMVAAGFTETKSFNPYWAQDGRTSKDDDGYRVVIQRAAWGSGSGG